MIPHKMATVKETLEDQLNFFIDNLLEPYKGKYKVSFSVKGAKEEAKDD